MRSFRLCAALAASLALSGCLVGPDYERPPSSMPASFVEAAASQPQSAVVAKPADVSQWWTRFDDPILTSLIDEACDENLDVEQARARIRQARALRTIAGAAELPTLDATASYTRAHAAGETSNLFRFGFDAAWELDLFGGARRGVEAADADYVSSVEGLRAVLVSLTSEVATTYTDLRGAQQELAITRRNLTAQQETAELTRQRHAGGFVGLLDVANAEAQVATTTSLIPPLETVVRQSIHALGVLLAMEPGALLAKLLPAGAQPPLPPEVPVGLPSELLRRRPDVRKAESDLHAATARIGVATADLFPKVSIGGSIGLQGRNPHEATQWANRFRTFGPSIDWPIFSGWAITGNIELQKGLTAEAFAAYKKSVLVALQESEDAIVAYRNEQDRRVALEDAVRSDREAVSLATELYTAGRTDFLNVLTAQRSQFDAEFALALSDRNVVADLVAVYKALGGGWESKLPSPEQ